MKKPTLMHYLALALFFGAGALHFLMGQPQLDSLLHLTPAVFATAGFVIALLSQALFGQATPPDPSNVAARKPPPGAVMTLLMALVLLFTLALSASGCKGTNFPTLDAFEKLVVTELDNGATDQQIAEAACAFLGGSSQTDTACADVGIEVADTIQLLIAMGVLQGPALARGHQYIAVHVTTAGVCK